MNARVATIKQERRPGQARAGQWNAQRGAALIISLVLLAVMTLIGVFAMRGTTLEERMAGNMRDRDMAFQAAEGALRDAERNFNRDMAFQDPTADSWEDRLDQGSTYEPDPVDNFQLASAARYVVEEFPPETPLEADAAMPDHRRYRVTAEAVGGSTEAVVILQSEFLR